MFVYFLTIFNIFCSYNVDARLLDLLHEMCITFFAPNFLHGYWERNYRPKKIYDKTSSESMKSRLETETSVFLNIWKDVDQLLWLFFYDCSERCVPEILSWEILELMEEVVCKRWRHWSKLRNPWHNLLSPWLSITHEFAWCVH